MDDVFVEVLRTASAASRTAACRRTSSRRRTRGCWRGGRRTRAWYDRQIVFFCSPVPHNADTTALRILYKKRVSSGNGFALSGLRPARSQRPHTGGDIASVPPAS